MYLVHIYAYPYKYTYIQVLMAQNSCISQPYWPGRQLVALLPVFVRCKCSHALQSISMYGPRSSWQTYIDHYGYCKLYPQRHCIAPLNICLLLLFFNCSCALAWSAWLDTAVMTEWRHHTNCIRQATSSQLNMILLKLSICYMHAWGDLWPTLYPSCIGGHAVTGRR